MTHASELCGVCILLSLTLVNEAYHYKVGKDPWPPNLDSRSYIDPHGARMALATCTAYLGHGDMLTWYFRTGYKVVTWGVYTNHTVVGTMPPGFYASDTHVHFDSMEQHGKKGAQISSEVQVNLGVAVKDGTTHAILGCLSYSHLSPRDIRRTDRLLKYIYLTKERVHKKYPFKRGRHKRDEGVVTRALLWIMPPTFFLCIIIIAIMSFEQVYEAKTAAAADKGEDEVSSSSGGSTDSVQEVNSEPEVTKKKNSTIKKASTKRLGFKGLRGRGPKSPPEKSPDQTLKEYDGVMYTPICPDGSCGWREASTDPSITL